MLATTAGSLSAIANFAVLLLIVLYIYALCGLTLFGGEMVDDEGEIPRANFNSVLDSITTVFMVMTRENWQVNAHPKRWRVGGVDRVASSLCCCPCFSCGALLLNPAVHGSNTAFLLTKTPPALAVLQETLYIGMRYSGWRAVPFFLTLIFITNYVLLSLFIGTLLEVMTARRLRTR